MAVVTLLIVGLCDDEVYPFGPVHDQEVAPVAEPVRVSVLVSQIGFGDAAAVTALGVELTVTVAVALFAAAHEPLVMTAL